MIAASLSRHKDAAKRRRPSVLIKPSIAQGRHRPRAALVALHGAGHLLIKHDCNFRFWPPYVTGTSFMMVANITLEETFGFAVRPL
jgi:hypothetical protein